MTRRKPRNPYKRLTPKRALDLVMQLQSAHVYAVENTKNDLLEHIRFYLWRGSRGLK